MNKELVFKKEMRAFDINVDDIKPDEHIFGAIEEAIIKMRNECLIDRLEVVLNNNLIDIKDKITDNRTILGCRLSYADLSKDVSFIVRQDNEPTYEQLQQENQNLEKQLEYLRSGEYYNQLRFENEMLQQVVDTNGVPSEVYDYIDCTHRNTELLKENQELKKQLEDTNEELELVRCDLHNRTSERDGYYRNIEMLENQQKEFIEYLENEINKIKEQIRNYDIWHEVGVDINFLILKKQFFIEILSNYKEIIGGK